MKNCLLADIFYKAYGVTMAVVGERMCTSSKFFSAETFPQFSRKELLTMGNLSLKILFGRNIPPNFHTNELLTKDNLSLKKKKKSCRNLSPNSMQMNS